MSKDILLLRDETIQQALSTGDGVDLAIAELSDIVRGYEHNIDTQAGRKKTASLAAKVSKVKTTIDAIGKEMVSGWKEQAKAVDANRKKLRDACDELRDEARKPLTDWEVEQERLEAEKVAAIEAEKVKALLLADHEIALLLNEKFDDDIAAKLILDAQAEEERKRIEREKIEREAKEKAERQLIEQREKLEQDKAEAEAKTKQDAIETEELKSHIERLRQAIDLMLKHGEQWEYKVEIAEYALRETPPQSVIKIKLAAIDDFIERFGDELTGDMTFEELYKVAEKYTKTLSN